MAVLADRAEEVDGKGSVIGIFQAVTARRFPTTRMQASRSCSSTRA